MRMFVEAFVLVVLAAVFTGLVVTPGKLDWSQRISLGVALIASAFFAAHTVSKMKAESKPTIVVEPVAVPQGPTKRTGDAEGGENHSPGNTGDDNTFDYNNSSQPKNRMPK